MPFERTAFPGLTVYGSVEIEGETTSLSSDDDWEAQVEESISFPLGLIDDVFLHVSLHRLSLLS